MRIRSVSRSRLSSSSSCHRGFHPGTAVMRFGRRGWVQVTISSSQTEVSGVPGLGAKVEEAALPKSLSHAICSHWRARFRKFHIVFWFRRGNICQRVLRNTVPPRAEVVRADGVPAERRAVHRVAGPGGAEVPRVEQVDEPPDPVVSALPVSATGLNTGL